MASISSFNSPFSVMTYNIGNRNNYRSYPVDQRVRLEGIWGVREDGTLSRTIGGDRIIADETAIASLEKVRITQIAQNILDTNPDLITLTEYAKESKSILNAHLVPKYEILYSRHYPNEQDGLAIIYRKDRFSLVDGLAFRKQIGYQGNKSQLSVNLYDRMTKIVIRLTCGQNDPSNPYAHIHELIHLSETSRVSEVPSLHIIAGDMQWSLGSRPINRFSPKFTSVGLEIPSNQLTNRKTDFIFAQTTDLVNFSHKGVPITLSYPMASPHLPLMTRFMPRHSSMSLLPLPATSISTVEQPLTWGFFMYSIRYCRKGVVRPPVPGSKIPIAKDIYNLFDDPDRSIIPIPEDCDAIFRSLFYAFPESTSKDSNYDHEKVRQTFYEALPLFLEEHQKQKMLEALDIAYQRHIARSSYSEFSDKTPVKVEYAQTLMCSGLPVIPFGKPKLESSSSSSSSNDMRRIPEVPPSLTSLSSQASVQTSTSSTPSFSPKVPASLTSPPYRDKDWKREEFAKDMAHLPYPSLPCHLFSLLNDPKREFIRRNKLAFGEVFRIASTVYSQYIETPYNHREACETYQKLLESSPLARHFRVTDLVDDLEHAYVSYQAQNPSVLPATPTPKKEIPATSSYEMNHHIYRDPEWDRSQIVQPPMRPLQPGSEAYYIYELLSDPTRTIAPTRKKFNEILRMIHLVLERHESNLEISSFLTSIQKSFEKEIHLPSILEMLKWAIDRSNGRNIWFRNIIVPPPSTILSTTQESSSSSTTVPSLRSVSSTEAARLSVTTTAQAAPSTITASQKKSRGSPSAKIAPSKKQVIPAKKELNSYSGLIRYKGINAQSTAPKQPSHTNALPPLATPMVSGVPLPPLKRSPSSMHLAQNVAPVERIPSPSTSTTVLTTSSSSISSTQSISRVPGGPDPSDSVPIASKPSNINKPRSITLNPPRPPPQPAVRVQPVNRPNYRNYIITTVVIALLAAGGGCLPFFGIGTFDEISYPTFGAAFASLCLASYFIYKKKTLVRAS